LCKAVEDLKEGDSARRGRYGANGARDVEECSVEGSLDGVAKEDERVGFEILARQDSLLELALTCSPFLSFGPMYLSDRYINPFLFSIPTSAPSCLFFHFSLEFLPL
jgi:hypothetical protein